jgi:hypothetical protein
MRINPNRILIAVFMFLLLLVSAGAVVAQEPKSLTSSAQGQGSIKFGKEEFKIYAVAVKLFADNKAEISLVTDFTVYVSGTWSRTDDASKEITIKITGGSASGNLEGGGKLLLTDDRKSIAGLNLQGTNRATGKVVRADFVTK